MPDLWLQIQGLILLELKSVTKLAINFVWVGMAQRSHTQIKVLNSKTSGVES